jgi:hypothetical protein
MLAPLLSLALAAGPLPFTSGAEEPQKLERVDLPPRCAVCPPGRVTCAWYAGFMVREVDLGDLGAEALAIVPRGRKRPDPACGPERVRGELSVTGAADPWSGYFEGARGRFVFFRAQESRGDALAFAVYDAETGERVHSDAAIGPAKISGKGERVGLSYVRRAVAPCSPIAEGEECWKRIRTALSVGGEPPDCAEPYRLANEEAAKAACQGAAAGARCVEAELRLRPAFPPFVPPALTYEVEMPDLGSPQERASSAARVLSCRPSE